MWNKEAQIAKMKPSVTKLLAHLQKNGIEFSHVDTESGLENVMFMTDKKTMKMSHHSFYRYSGIAVICIDKGDNFSETKEVTDDMYMNIFMKPIIEKQFDIK